MLFCNQLSIEKWSPDFSTPALSNPVWTQARWEKVQLCNSLEWTAWNENPVQVQLCDACGTVGCASGGYINLSALQDLVLWTRPRSVDNPGITDDESFFPSTAIERFGSVAIPCNVWQELRFAASEVPELGSLAHADGSVLCDAWVAGRTRPKVTNQLVPWLQSRLLAADTLDTSAAIYWVGYWLEWFGQRAKMNVHGSVANAEDIGATVEKLYFDGPGTDDWPALAQYRDSFVPAFGPHHVFVPDE